MAGRVLGFLAAGASEGGFARGSGDAGGERTARDRLLFFLLLFFLLLFFLGIGWCLEILWQTRCTMRTDAKKKDRRNKIASAKVRQTKNDAKRWRKNEN